MKIQTTYDPKPIPDRQYDWSAIDESTYDGAEDSSNRHMIGYGATEAEAIDDLQRLLQERDEYFETEEQQQCAPFTDAEIDYNLRMLERLFGFREE